MFKFISKFLKAPKKLEEAEARIVLLGKEIGDWVKSYTELSEKYNKLQDPRELIKKVFLTDVSWYDYNELDKASLAEYKRYAELLRRNPVFVNETNFLIQNLAKLGLQEAKNWEELTEMRQRAVALSDLKYRIDEIPRPDTAPEIIEDPYAAV